MTDIPGPHSDDRRGAIRNETAYARGKMLDHASWQGDGIALPRNVTPSDIDMLFDNRGAVLFGEISSDYTHWDELKNTAYGQFLAYQNTIKHTSHLAILCKHSVPLQNGRLIDTRNDINSFQVMLHNLGNNFLFTEVYDGNNWWQRFVLRWYNDAALTRRICLKNALDQEQDDAVGVSETNTDAGMFAEVVT